MAVALWLSCLDTLVKSFKTFLQLDEVIQSALMDFELGSARSGELVLPTKL